MTEAPVDMPEVVRSIVNAHKTDRGALLPILHEIQRQFGGYIDAECVPVVAAELNLSRADVHGVMTFYSDFRSEPGGATTVRMCRAEACQAVGAERLVAHAEQVFGIKVGITDPLSTSDYKARGGLAGLRRALGLHPADVVAEVTESGLRGRGGAGFPAGIKWKTVLDTPGELKFVCCNADEGDSGTFADRMLMEGDPFCLIEGMTIAAHAVGAVEGYLYIRSEYPDAVATMRAAIEIAYGEGWLGENILGSGLRCDLHVRVGAGAYICGEETSMLESLEGKRPMVRSKPPIPAITGLFGNRPW